MNIVIKVPYQQQYEISEVELQEMIKLKSLDIENTYIWYSGLENWISVKSYIETERSETTVSPNISTNQSSVFNQIKGGSEVKGRIPKIESLGKLNLFQRGIITFVCLAVFGMIIYPPFKVTLPSGGATYNMGYAFILNPPKLHQGQPSMAFIDISTLVIQSIAVLIFSGTILLIYGYFPKVGNLASKADYISTIGTSISSIKNQFKKERLWIASLVLLYVSFAVWHVKFTGVYKNGIFDPRIASVENLISCVVGTIFGIALIPVLITFLWSVVKRFMLKSERYTLIDYLKIFTTITILSLSLTALGALSSKRNSKNQTSSLFKKSNGTQLKQSYKQSNTNSSLVNLPKGVSLLLPQTWTVLSKQLRDSLDNEKNVSMPKLSVINATSDLSFVANYFIENNTTAALLNIRYYPNMTVTQSESERMDAEEIQKLDKYIYDNIKMGEKDSGWSLMEWRGTKRQVINGSTAFVTEYTRTGINNNGSFCTRLIRFFRGSESYTISIGYKIEDESSLRPICDKVISSIRNN